MRGAAWVISVSVWATSLAARAQPVPEPPSGDIPQPPPGYGEATPPPSGLPEPVPEVVPPGPAPVAGPIPQPVPSRLEVPAPGTPPGFPVCLEPRDDPPGARTRPADGMQRCRAGTPERVELYAWAGLFGLGTFAWLAEIIGAASDGSGGLLLGLVGLAAGIVGTYALDRIDGGMVPGVPAMISTALLLGFFEGAAVQGAFFPEVADGPSGAAAPVIGAFSTATLVGLLSFEHEPTVGDALLVRTGMIWGTMLGLMLGFAATDLDEELAGDYVLVGFNLGTLASALIAASTDISPARALWLNVGGVVGILAGVLAVGISGDAELRAGHAAVMGVTTLGGLVISWSFSDE